LDRAVIQRPQPIFCQQAPFFGFYSAGKNIGVKCRRAHHRQNCAVVNVQRDDGSFPALERFESSLLQLPIQSEVNRITGNINHFVQHPHSAP
jgi:hypothetical protein